MKEITLRKKGPEIEIKDILIIEKNLNIKLPDSYKDFLLTFNGGIIDNYDYFLCKTREGDIEELAWFYGINDDISYNIELNNTDLIYDTAGRRLSEGLFIIGSNGGGQICLDLNKGNNYGKVVFWVNGEELDGEEREQLRKGEKPYYWTDEMYQKYLDENGKFNEFYNVYPIADSFEEFIDGLMTEGEREEYLDKLGEEEGIDKYLEE